MKALSPILAVGLALVFGAAGVLKLADPFTFSREIELYLVLGTPWTGVLAVYLPWLELFTAVALLFPRWRLGAAMVALGLSVIFTAALTSAAVRGLEVRSGCFGSVDPAMAVGALVRVGAVALVAGAVVWLERRRAGETFPPEKAPVLPSDESNL